MKKSRIYILISIMLILGIIIVFYNLNKKPLRNLNALDVISIEALAQPPNEIKHIDKREDIETIVSRLREIVVYDKVKQNDTCGQIITYTLTMKDGSKREFMISNPIVNLDGIFYKTQYAPAESLSNLYKELDYNTIKR